MKTPNKSPQRLNMHFYYLILQTWCLSVFNCSHEKQHIDRLTVLSTPAFSFETIDMWKKSRRFSMSCFFSACISHGCLLLPFSYGLLSSIHYLQSCPDLRRFPLTDLRTAISFQAQFLTDPNFLMLGLAWTHTSTRAMNITVVINLIVSARFFFS